MNTKPLFFMLGILGLFSLFVAIASFPPVRRWAEEQANCVPTKYEATVKTVYFSPRGYANREHWRGVAVSDKTEVEYEVYHPVAIGDVIVALRGCGEVNQPF